MFIYLGLYCFILAIKGAICIFHFFVKKFKNDQQDVKDRSQYANYVPSAS